MRGIRDGLAQHTTDSASVNLCSQRLSGAWTQVFLKIAGKLDSLCYCNDREALAAMLSGANVLPQLRDGKRDLRNQDDVRASGKSCMQRNPAGVAAHHLDQHDALVRFRGAVQLVDGVRCSMYSRVKAKRTVGGHQVVVDGLGNSYKR